MSATTRSTLILGGARSGKSRFAEQLARQQERPVIYVATARPAQADEEMEQRIAEHRRRRPKHWKTHEVALSLPEAIDSADTEAFLLIDCLTLWLGNLLMEAPNTLPQQQEMLCHAITARRAPTVLVSSEVGLGIVPEHPLGRMFRDAQGSLNQEVAATCDRVELIVAGLPMRLK